MSRTPTLRKITFQEDDEEYSVGKMKELTGGDSPFSDDILGAINFARESNIIYARSLKQDPSLPEFRLILNVNTVPSIPCDDGPKFYFFDREELKSNLEDID